MSLLQAIILGIIQGITEFLPISSSGHLVIAPYLFGWNIPSEDAFIFDVLVQVATLLAVFAYFRNELWQIAKGFIVSLWKRQPFSSPQARLGWYLILASIPAGLIGISFKGLIEKFFSNPLAVAFFLLVTSGLLILGEMVGSRSRSIDQLNWKDAVVMGLFQSLALFPGVSRSGSTITGGMVRNLQRSDAARFSFLMSIPIMLAAGAVALSDLVDTPDVVSRLPSYLWGFLSAAVVGYLAIRWLLRYLTNHPLYIFAFYTASLAVFTILIYALRSV